MRFFARLAAALLALPVLLIAPGVAQAHDTLVSTTPKSGATTAPVQSVSMVFNEAVLNTGAAVTVTGPDGPVAQGAPSINGATVSQDLRQPLANGSYAVTWRVLSSDGHPISGVFKFTVAGASQSPSTATSSEGGQTLTSSAATSSAPTPPAQQVPTTATDNNAPLIIAAAVLALLLIAGGAYLAKSRLKDDNADLKDDDADPTPDEDVSGRNSHDADRDAKD